MEQSRPSSALLVRVPGAICAFPLAEVIEIMRPRPVEPLPNTPDFVRGVARIRGVAVPVVYLAALFHEDHRCDLPTRFVMLRVGQRRVAIAVQSVIGIADLSDQALDNLPPLVKTVRTPLIQTLGMLDAEFLVMLNTSYLVPESVWQALALTRAMP